MGTNYYFKIDDNYYHIGKSSIGWEFTWKTQPDLDVYSKQQWKEFITNNSGEIENEYGIFVNKVEFFNEIANNMWRWTVFSNGNEEYKLKSHYRETVNETNHFVYLDKYGNSFIMEEFE